MMIPILSRLKIGDQTLKAWRLIKYHETSEIWNQMDTKLMQERTGSLNIVNGCVVGPFILLASGIKFRYCYILQNAER